MNNATTLYKRNAKGDIIRWQIHALNDGSLSIAYGKYGCKPHTEIIMPTLKKADELTSRIKAKRKEGYKSIQDLWDNSPDENHQYGSDFDLDSQNVYNYLNTYLPKYSTTEEGFVLPMLSKTLDDNKPFEKIGPMIGQWKIDGLRCIIGAEKDDNTLFDDVHLTYHSREGLDWTDKLKWMDDVILPYIKDDLLDMMVEEGVCLDGELYLPGYAVNDINSFVKNPKLPQHFMLQYWCYDICMEGISFATRDNYRMSFIARRAYDFHSLQEHMNSKNQFILLPSYDNVNSIDNATYYRDKFVDLGFEGLILRNPAAEYQFGKRNSAMFKFKKIFDGKFEIVEIKEEHKRSDLPLFVLRNDINSELFECSINKPHDIQREILINKEKYVGRKMLVEYRARSGVSQVPFHARGINIINKA